MKYLITIGHTIKYFFTNKYFVNFYKIDYKTKLWLLGFEPRSPRPQRGILTTKLQPQHGYLLITKFGSKFTLY